MGIRRWLTSRIVDFLNQPLPNYVRREWNHPDLLRRHIRKGDVVLVEGDQRISGIIKYLTQSCWSHSVLYIGDEILSRGGAPAAEVQERFGEEAGHLVVEALPDGVTVTPLMRYIDYNIRICRPHSIRPDHLKSILDEALDAVGWQYDVQNVLDLARYMVGISLVPGRYRPAALRFGSGTQREVICSSLIGQLFQNVGFPVRPSVERAEVPPSVERGLLKRFFRRVPTGYPALYRRMHPTLLTPRDFDLSPYFEIVKFNAIADGNFDYQRIHWVHDLEEEEPVEAPTEEVATVTEED